ncbi:MAG: sodium:solute symporter, partial [Bacteroidota bacterium]
IVMTVASIAVGIIAMRLVSPEMLAERIPDDWTNLFFGWELNLDWTGIMDSVNTKIADDGWEIFGWFFMMTLFKGIIISAAGPAPNYDMQRILSTKSPTEASKMSGLVNIALFFPRYMLIAGLGALALVFFSDDLNAMGADIDFELILPYAIKNFVPVGLMGLLIAGLLAAFMSTFAATVNAAPAYLINDIYRKYVRPDADDKHLVRMSYLASAVVVVIGISFGFMAESINSVTQWIVSALWGGYAAANMLKWYWWRFNGHGFFWGMVVGIIASVLMFLPDVLPETSALAQAWPKLTPLQGFPWIFGVSLIACFVGSYLTPETDPETINEFYRRVRPWGFWEPVKERVMAADPDFTPNQDFWRDMLNIAIGIVWQTSMIVAAIFLIIQKWPSFWISLAVMAATTVILKFTWWDKLED